MKRWLLLSLLTLVPLAHALEPPYDAAADAGAQVQRVLAACKKAHRPTLRSFGANWCGDCRALDVSLHTAKNPALVNAHFEVVKIDVGNFDHNLEPSRADGDPIEKGIPAAVVVGADGRCATPPRPAN
ncbi:thioredoxin family protein [Xanthomonas theicola]|uniref:thioredoxin family protein n=1 Tax=Xanthomonas theicola TaxID=56464 RepID=UPI001FE44C61|nr:thioredoxin family protein [Xanthomonas theicola]